MAETAIQPFGQGVPGDGKPIEHLKLEELEVLQKRVMQERVLVTRMRNEQQEHLKALQDDVEAIRDRAEQRRAELDALKRQNQVELGQEEKGRISRVTLETLGQFVTIRSRAELEEVLVDVRFLPGGRLVGGANYGTGAGSVDAQFKVHLEDKVERLAVQAAKYWGLDADQVFFLDRDSRIVPDAMLLSEIILPPIRHGASSSTAPAQEYPVLEGSNYVFTLVQAGTVLAKEDLTQPKGDAWNDFTFDRDRLDKELESMRRRHGDHGDLPVVNMDEIPCLLDLINQGQERKIRKQWDTRCRILEFVVFLAVWALFYYVINPSGREQLQLYLVASAAMQGPFNTDAFASIRTHAQYTAYIDSTLQKAVVPPAMNSSNLIVIGAVGYLYKGQNPDLSSSETFCVIPPTTTSTTTNTTTTTSTTSTRTTTRGNTTNSTTSTTRTSTVTTTTSSTSSSSSSSSTRSTTVTTSSTSSTSLTTTRTATGTLTATARRMRAVPASDWGDWEEEDEDPPVNVPARWSGRFLQAVSNLSNKSNKTNTTNSTNGTNGSAQGVAAVPPCVSPEFQTCLNSRVVRVFEYAKSSNASYPPCEPQYPLNDVKSFIQSFNVLFPFSYFAGQVSSYAMGDLRSVSLANATAFRASIPEFRNETSPGVGRYLAKLLVFFVYAPSANGLIVFQLLIENSLSGIMITSENHFVLDFNQLEPERWFVWCLIVILSCVVLLLEIRRIWGCPKRFFYEQERDQRSCRFYLFVLLPVMLMGTLSLLSARESRINSSTLFRLDDAGYLTKQSMMDLYELQGVITFIIGFKLATVLLINTLFMSYLLLFFPQLAVLSHVINKLALPLFYTLLYLVLAFLTFGAFLFVLFASKFADFKSPQATAVTVVQLMMGGARDWSRLYNTASTMWTVIVTLFFVIITLFLNNIAGAIMLSHVKEKDSSKVNEWTMKPAP